MKDRDRLKWVCVVAVDSLNGLWITVNERDYITMHFIHVNVMSLNLYAVAVVRTQKYCYNKYY